MIPLEFPWQWYQLETDDIFQTLTHLRSCCCDRRRTSPRRCWGTSARPAPGRATTTTGPCVRVLETVASTTDEDVMPRSLSGGRERRWFLRGRFCWWRWKANHVPTRTTPPQLLEIWNLNYLQRRATLKWADGGVWMSWDPANFGCWTFLYLRENLDRRSNRRYFFPIMRMAGLIFHDLLLCNGSHNKQCTIKKMAYLLLQIFTHIVINKWIWNLTIFQKNVLADVFSSERWKYDQRMRRVYSLRK